MAQLIFFMETLTLLFQLLQKLKIDLKQELYILQFMMSYSLQKEGNIHSVMCGSVAP